MANDIVNDVLAARYFQPGETKWEDVCKRVAEFVGDTTDERDAYYNMMKECTFLPNSPTLMNAGTKDPMLSACFVLPIDDSMESIFETIKNTALIHKAGGGTGFTFGHLRPEGDQVGDSKGTASGPISFMKVFNAATDAVKQGSRRRGANMGVLPIWHPDIEKFIECKEQEGELSNFNISIMIDDTFMKAVDNDNEYVLKFEGKEYKKINARVLFDKLVDHAWKNGEPGVLFYNTINKGIVGEERIEATNPCAEQPLLPYESCNLGSINVSNFIYGNGKFDWYSYAITINRAVDFLNKVLNKNKYPISEIDKKTKKSRKIGLGIMGFHDALIKMGIAYDSEEGYEFGKKLMFILTNNAREWSKKYNYNNECVTTVAPTGSVATIAGCSYGIEPIFALVHKRYTWASGEKIGYRQAYEPFERKLFALFKNDEDKYNYVIDHAFEKGTIQDIEWLPIEFKKQFKTALDISWESHINMQAAFQAHCDAGISKTINMPFTATKQDVYTAIFKAWNLGCKGLTIYRSGSRENEVLELKKDTVEVKEMTETKTESVMADSRSATFVKPRERMGITYERQSGCGKLYITINEINGKPYEVFVRTAGVGGCEANSTAIGRLISLLLRNSIPPKDIVRQLRRVKCAAAIKNNCDGKSCADIIGKCLEEYYDVVDESSTTLVESFLSGSNDWNLVEDEKPMIMTKEEANPKMKCPECGEPIVLAEGCMVCNSCGWSKCK